MELYIQIKDGQPFEHPILGDNFCAAFPDVDVNNLLMISETPTYELVDGVYKDVWHIRNMTDAEKTAKQQAVKDAWAALPNLDNFSAWVFNEAACGHYPPIPSPGANYFWQGTTASWVEIPQWPDDDKQYTLDFASATWVEVTP